MSKLEISKIDAAKRQLETAIELYFHRGDEVSIHTLAAAACNVMRDINKQPGNEFSWREELTKLIVPEMQKEFLDKLKEAENYFKHADRDPNTVLGFSPKQTEFIVWEAGELYEKLSGENVPLIHLFRGWYILQNKTAFVAVPGIKPYLEFFNDKEIDRSGYFKNCLPLLMRQPAR
ncbi:MAG: hypothetical protein HZA03_06905 [Nitrospinae bacterium]|nr:hypothetical protein [Nitrospinota bacterium]